MSSLGPTPSKPDAVRFAFTAPAARVIVSVVIALGLLATSFAYSRGERAARIATREEFARMAEGAALRLEGRLRGFEEALHAGAGFVMGSDRVSPVEWLRFEETLRIPHLLPGAMGMAYAVRDPGANGLGFSIADNDSAGATVRPDPLKLPEAGTAASLACVSGEVAGFLWPAQSEVVLVRAVYRAGAVARRSFGCADSLAGLVILRFRPATLTRALSEDGGRLVSFHLLARRPDGGDLPLGDPGPAAKAAAHVRAIPFDFGGRAWTLEARSLPRFHRAHARHLPAWLLAGGLIITLLAGALAGSEANRRHLAREAARAMRQSLELTTTQLSQSTARSLETEGRLAGLIDSAMDGIVSLDRGGRVRLMNPAAERMLRCSSGQVAGISVARFFPAQLQEVYRRELVAFARGARYRTFGVEQEALACRFDGEEFPIEATISLAETEGQRSYTLIMRDVSERQRTELARRGLEAQLRQSQKMEAMGTLAGGIAHDFNNILGSILGNAEMAEQDLPEGHGAREFVMEITRAAERARDLVRRILGFSRQQEQARQPIHLDQVTEEVGRMVRVGLPASIELILDKAPDAPPVLADAGQIHQVLMNLITNSAHAIGDRKGSIRVSLRRIPAGSDTALPAALIARDCLELSVADDGSGMAPGVLERVFDPFFTTKPVGQGTGLGLSVVHGIVEQHEGVIRVTSAPGAGATMRVLFPGLVEAPAAPAEAARPMPMGHGERVLLVDDEPALLTMGGRILRRLGYTPVVAEGPAHALSLVEDGIEEVDIVLTDYSMPGMSGIELAARLLKIRPDLPIILFTGYGRWSSPGELQAQGIRAVLAKPVAIRALADTLAAQNPVHA